MTPWITCRINNAKVKLLIDSGSDVTTLSESDWVKVQRVPGNLELKQGKGIRALRAYASEKPLEIRASCEVAIRVDETGKTVRAPIFVIKGAKKSLLGREAAIALGVLRLGPEVSVMEVTEQKEFPKVPDEVISFDIDPAVPPTQNAYYHVPISYRDRARDRLAEKQALGIIEPVTVAPRWISGMSLVPKGKDDFRLVVNMRGPNKAIRRAFHPLPTIEEIRTKLVGSGWYSKLDIKNAFYHLELDEKSRELTTFQTENGMMRYTRLLFGVNCAPEMFQRMMERKLSGIEGLIIFMDDVLIYACDVQTLRARTQQSKQALAKNNLTINEEKCEYDQQKISFLGHRLSSQGFEIEAEKIRDIQGFRAPTDASSLRSFLGLANYLSEYIQNFADLVNPMWEVLKKGNYSWGKEANKAFQATKQAICHNTVKLGFFDTNKKTVLYADASPIAVGAVLAQEDDSGKDRRIISFASKTLTETERRYPQIQREALAIVWSVERFYFYLLGRHFTIRTDARGLSFIFDREKVSCKRALNRAEGWALRLGAYDYEIEWIKGRENIADPSSRLCAEAKPFASKIYIPAEIGVVTESLRQPFDAMPLTEVEEESAKDGEQTKVKKAITNGTWEQGIPSAFSKLKAELRITGGLITKNGAIVLPAAVRSKALYLAHRGHPGITAMKTLMRARVWWPGISANIEKWVADCEGCALASRGERPAPLQGTSLPDEPWEKLAVDFNGPHSRYGGRSVLVMIDYHSRFIVAKFVKSTDFSSIHPVLVNTFELLGNPVAIRADNGPPFNGRDWLAFCGSRAITCEFSVPGCPRQNGLVEAAMKLVNKSLTIAAEKGDNAEQALADTIAAHNMAAQRTTETAPDLLLLHRVRRARLPVISATRQVDLGKIREKDAENKGKAMTRQNNKRRARDPSIQPGDEVFIKRINKAKDQTNFDPERMKVMARSRGELTLQDAGGREFRRDIAQTKKAPRRDIGPLSSILQKGQNLSGRAGGGNWKDQDGNGQPEPRTWPKRVRTKVKMYNMK